MTTCEGFVRSGKPKEDEMAMKRFYEQKWMDGFWAVGDRATGHIVKTGIVTRREARDVRDQMNKEEARTDAAPSPAL